MEDAATSRGHAHWIVAGRVQGVGFRWFVQRAARRRGIRGLVRNLRDGRVEVRAEGATAELEALLGEVRQGPPGAFVESVEQLAADPGQRYDGFDIGR
jgi:acylphosphatase